MRCAPVRRQRRPCGSPGTIRTCSIPWSGSEYEKQDESARRPTGGPGKAAHMSSDAVTTVSVEERMYAAGKIPGSFFKREGRAGEKGTLTARMIDRPIRPLFPKGWHFETQLVAMPLSVDHVHPYDILAMNGASAALMLSPIPFPTPVGAVRIGKVEGNFVINPTEEQMLEAGLRLVVSGTDKAILLV